MNSRTVAKVGGVLMVSLGALNSANANYFPFETTPEEFIAYLNTTKMNISGSTFLFLRAYDCYQDEYPSGVHRYSCDTDYREASTLGERVCRTANVTKVSLAPNVKDRYYEVIEVPRLQKSKECSAWEKVSSTPEPQSQPTPPPSQSQTSTTSSATWDNKLILAGGAGILVLGGLLGVVFSKLLGRKKD